MKESTSYLHSQRGSASAKFLALLVFIGLLAHAGYNYVPVAYNGAAFKQEMDTAVVKGLAASGRGFAFGSRRRRWGVRRWERCG